MQEPASTKTRNSRPEVPFGAAPGKTGRTRLETGTVLLQEGPFRPVGHLPPGRREAWCGARVRLPRRVPVKKAVKGDVITLAVERKHLADLFKMVAYQDESDLVRLVAKH